MAIIDPVADLLIRIKNATKANLPLVVIQYSNLAASILDVLKQEGYINDYEVKKSRTSNKRKLFITLKYKDNISAISGVRQISKPGLRVYMEAKKLPKVLNGLGIAIISTNLGMMTDKKARTSNVGGEVIAYV